MSIKFYKTEGAYGCFSNFAAYPFELDGQVWPTSEHYFQAQKFADEAYREKIRQTPSPMIAARLGRSRAVPIRADWERVKDDVMRKAVRAKFRSHGDIATILVATGEEDIIEDAAGDSYWGCGADGNGKNMLGHILVKVRAELRREALSVRQGQV